MAFFRKAIQTVWLIRHLVALHYIASLIFAIIALLPFDLILSRAINGRSLAIYDNNLLHPDFFMDLEQTVDQAFMLNLWIGVTGVFIFAAFSFFLSGGTLAAIKNPQQKLSEFWSLCAKLFPLNLLALGILTLVWLPLLVGLGFLGLWLDRSLGFDDLVLPNMIRLAIIAPAIFLWHRSLDLARIHLAQWPEDGVFSACFAAVLFVLRHISSLILVSLIYLIPIGVLTLLGFTVLTGPTNAGTFLFIIFAFLTQVTVALRFYLRVAFLAHESAFYHSRHV